MVQEREATLPPEPPATSAEPVTTCLLRLPDGSRTARRFRRTDPVQLLFHFADAKVFIWIVLHAARIHVSTACQPSALLQMSCSRFIVDVALMGESMCMLQGAGGFPPGKYNLVTQFPRRCFGPGSDLSLAAAGLTSSQEALFLEPISDADS